MKDYLTADEAAEYLRVTKRVLCYTLKIPYSKAGGKRLYKQKDLDNYVEKQRSYPIDIRRKSKVKFVS